MNCSLFYKRFYSSKYIYIYTYIYMFTSFPSGSVVKNLPANTGDGVQALGCKDPLEKEMATYSSLLGTKQQQCMFTQIRHR